MNAHYKLLIADEFSRCVNRAIEQSDAPKTYQPFHEALLPEDALFWSAFERSFSTSFGQRGIEEIARLVALSSGATKAERQVKKYIQIDKAYEDAIQEELRLIKDKSNVVAWEPTLKRILDIQKTGNTIEIRLIFDLWWHKDVIDNYISLKTVKPNIDQTASAKADCLRLAVTNPNCNVYFGLPYNPYAKRKEDYTHKPPMTVFDFKNDSVVLIGKEMWDTIGGEGRYEELLDIASAVGKETRYKIEQIRG